MRKTACEPGRGPRFGKLFYTVCALLAACAIAVPTVAVLSYSGELKRAGDQIEAGVLAVVTNSIDQHRSMRMSADYLSLASAPLRTSETLHAAVEGASSQDTDALCDLVSQVEKRMEEDKGDQDAVYVYVDGSESVIGSNGVHKLSQGDLHLPDSERLQGIVRIAQTDGTPLTLFNENEMTSVRVYPLIDGATLLIVKTSPLRTDLLASELESISPTYALAYYDSFGTVHRYSDANNLASLFQRADFPAEDEVTSFRFENEGHPYVCAYYSYGDSKTTMAVFVEDTSTVTARRTDAILAITLGSLVLACGMGLLYFTRKVYRPLQSLVEHVAPQHGFDEVHAVEQAVDALEEENRAHRALLADTELVRALHGMGPSFEETEAPGFPVAEGSGCIIVIARADSDSGPKTRAARESMRTHVFDNLRRTAASAERRVAHVEDGMLDVFVVESNGSGSHDTSDVATIRAALQSVSDNDQADDGTPGEVPFSFFISGPAQTGGGLKSAYDQVCELSDRCLRSERYGVVVACTDLSENAYQSAGIGIDYARVQALADALKRGDTQGALGHFDAIASDMSAKPSVPLDKSAPAFATLSSALYMGVAACPLAGTEADRWVDELRREVEGARSLRDVRTAVEAALSRMSNASDRADTDRGHFDQVEAFVTENLSDPNLSAQMTASRFNMCPSNVTRLFKKYTGTGFVSYVHNARIEVAKAALVGSDAPLPDIAEMAGFGNVLTMTRAFKKVTGTTPGAYRQSMRRNG